MILPYPDYASTVSGRRPVWGRYWRRSLGLAIVSVGTPFTFVDDCDTVQVADALLFQPTSSNQGVIRLAHSAGDG